ncbi:MAG TPA: hypothetical protein VII94_04150 [Candidatus Saccharimonadales bacterium]
MNCLVCQTPLEQYEKSLYSLQCPINPTNPHFTLYNDLWTAYISGFRIHFINYIEVESQFKCIFVYDDKDKQIKVYEHGSLELMTEVIQRFQKLKVFI